MCQKRMSAWNKRCFVFQVQAASDKCKSVLSCGFLVIKVAVKCLECVLFTQWLQTPLWPIVLCRHMTTSVHQAPCATMCVYFGLEHLVIWDLAVVFVLNLVKIHDLWEFCVCREPHGLGCQYNSRSRGYCVFSAVIETICVFLLLPCYNCAVWGDRSLLERKYHDTRLSLESELCWLSRGCCEPCAVSQTMPAWPLPWPLHSSLKACSLF